MTVTTNPYLEGNFAPVLEEVTATDLPVTGHVPEALSGRYLRNGPNPVSAPEPSTYHWFTGDGMVHGIRLRDGPGRVVPQPLGALRRRWPQRSARSPAPGRCTPAWTSRPTPT